MMRKLILILLTFAIYGCDDEDYDTNLTSQTKSIESFVSKYPHQIQDGVYVIVTEIGEIGASTISVGDSVYINYTAMNFTTKPDSIITTNIKEVAEKEKFTTPKEMLVPFGIKWGTTPLIPGLAGALKWVTKGESILAIMPFNLGYGDDWHSMVPPYTALAFEIQIVDIIKRDEK
ncbi:MAG: FKBP-type peptidyl-prolyl cis-trans isomerase [Rikenellaceae bacterium]